MFDYPKVIFLGDEGSGKTLGVTLAVMDRCKQILDDRKNKPQNPEQRIWSTYPLSTEILNYFLLNKIKYQQIEFRDIHKCRNGLLLIDELEVNLDARNYPNLSIDTRRFLAQANKLGVDILGTAQYYAQIDISFRRLCKNVFYAKKIMGTKRPRFPDPSQRYWGLFKYTHMVREFVGETSEPKLVPTYPLLQFFTGFRFASHDILILNATSQEVEESPPAPLRKIVRICPEDNYKQVRYI